METTTDRATTLAVPNASVPSADIERCFEFAKMDYGRLGTQEQRLMDKRSEHWGRFFTILAIPGGAAGIVGVPGAVYLLALIPFFLACVALEVKHDEQVLRYDVRKQMKLLAKEWGFANHESKFSLQNEHQKRRWWHGYYKHGRSASFIAAEGIAAVVVAWYFASSVPRYGLVLSVALTLLNVFFVLVTAWCML